MMEYVTLDLRPETPFVHLYPDPDWPLRPSEVKGLWRWWFTPAPRGWGLVFPYFR